MKIRRINENRNFALQELSDHPIFDGAIEEGGIKKIGVLLVGLGGYGTELLKAFSWCAQMPGYEFTIHVFDKEKGEDKIKAAAPEFIEKNHTKEPTEAHYDIHFHDDTDVNSDKFIEELKKLKGITRVYVALGDDERNIETALKIRTVLERERQKNPSLPEPPIYPIVYSAAKTESVMLAKMQSDLGDMPELKNMEGKEYKIYFIGALKTRYSLKSVERAELEDAALKLHLHWSKTELEIEKASKKYQRFEYFRNSSMAQAVYRRLIDTYANISAADDEKEKILMDYEHRRWNAYTRADGYVFFEKPGFDPAKDPDKDHIAKTHRDLRSTKALQEAKDELSKIKVLKDK